MKDAVPMRHFAVLFALFVFSACESKNEDEAKRLCTVAESMEASEPRGALLLRRKVWEEYPTAGTVAASDCVREVRERMGKVRSLVAHDVSGDPKAVEGCEWTATVVEVFDGSAKLPYREHWARRLVERCRKVVGRAWTREPDSERLWKISDRLKALLDKR